MNDCPGIPLTRLDCRIGQRFRFIFGGPLQFYPEFGIVAGHRGICIAVVQLADFFRICGSFLPVNCGRIRFTQCCIEETDVVDQKVAGEVTEPGLGGKPFRTDINPGRGIGQRFAFADAAAVEFPVQIDFCFASIERDQQVVPDIGPSEIPGDPPLFFSVMHITGNGTLDIKTFPMAEAGRIFVTECGVNVTALQQKIHRAGMISAHQQRGIP